MNPTNHRLAATLAAAVLPAVYAVPALAGPITTGTTVVVADTTTAAPDNNGSFSNFDSSVALNDAGQAAYVGVLTGTSGGSSDNNGIFRGDGTTLTQVARGGQAAPGGNGSFSSFDSRPALNDAGQAAFRGILTGTSDGQSDNEGIYRGDGTTLTQVARTGQAAPDGNGSFSSFGFNPALNDAGQAAFFGALTGTSGGSSDNVGIFRGDGTTLTQLARRGQAAPDGNGSFSGFGPRPALNDAGQAAFFGALTGTSGGSSDDIGLFRGDGTMLTQLAREGQAAPASDGMLDGVLSNLFVPALNDLGQLAFLGDIDLQDGGPTDDELGLFFHDDLLGLTSVARTGESFDGSTITGLTFSPGGIQQDEGSGPNNLGQVAYGYTLADGRTGVAVWSIPEPSAAGSLGLLSAFALRRRRRVR